MRWKGVKDEAKDPNDAQGELKIYLNVSASITFTLRLGRLGLGNYCKAAPCHVTSLIPLALLCRSADSDIEAEANTQNRKERKII